MNPESEFPFDRARRVTPEEHQQFKAALKAQFGTKLQNEPEFYESVSIQLNRKVLIWAKEEAEKRGVEYQIVINEVLLRQVS